MGLEVLWRSSVRRQHQIPSALIHISNTDVQPVFWLMMGIN